MSIRSLKLIESRMGCFILKLIWTDQIKLHFVPLLFAIAIRKIKDDHFIFCPTEQTILSILVWTKFIRIYGDQTSLLHSHVFSDLTITGSMCWATWLLLNATRRLKIFACCFVDKIPSNTCTVFCPTNSPKRCFSVCNDFSENVLTTECKLCCRRACSHCLPGLQLTTFAFCQNIDERRSSISIISRSFACELEYIDWFYFKLSTDNVNFNLDKRLSIFFINQKLIVWAKCLPNKEHVKSRGEGQRSREASENAHGLRVKFACWQLTCIDGWFPVRIDTHLLSFGFGGYRPTSKNLERVMGYFRTFIDVVVGRDE